MTSRSYFKFYGSLATSRSDPPLAPNRFDDLLKTLTFTNGADEGLVRQKYRKVFDATFLAPEMTELEFRGCEWKFSAQDLWNASLVHCAPRLLRLDLSGNYLRGSIDVFANLVCIQHLNLSDNRLTGSFWPLVDELPSLRAAIFKSCTNLDFATGLDQIRPHLLKLDLSGNSLRGSIDVFANLVSIQHLNLSDNRLTGSFWPLMDELPSLRAAIFKSCTNLDFATGLDQIRPHLLKLDLSGNSLRGSRRVRQPRLHPTSEPVRQQADRQLLATGGRAPFFESSNL